MKIARSLRVRLAMMYLMVFGLIQVLLGASILTLREFAIRHDFDVFLRDRAHDLAFELETDARKRPPEAEDFPEIRPRRPRTGHWELRRPDGSVVQSSESLGQLSLPWQPPANPRHGSVRIYSARTGPIAEALGPVRIAVLYQDPPGFRPYYIQLARETSPMERNIAHLRQILLVLIPMGLLAAAAAAHIVARRSLRPIGRIVREAQSITAADLSRRLPKPEGVDELGRLIDVLNNALDRLQKAFASQERFTADVSHELKTPLMSLAAEAQTMLRPEATDQQRRAFLQRLTDDTERLARTVESFLMLARADAGFPIAHPQAVPLAEVVTDAMLRCAQEASARQVRVRAKLPEGGAELACTGDPDLLRSMAENLLRNAIRHTPHGTPVDLELRSENGSALLLVRDQGPGIPAEHLERMFDRFARLTDSNAGTGLGLPIARAIARLHGGQIRGQRPSGGGFEMAVRLPVANQPADQAVF